VLHLDLINDAPRGPTSTDDILEGVHEEREEGGGIISFKLDFGRNCAPPSAVRLREQCSSVYGAHTHVDTHLHTHAQRTLYATLSRLRISTVRLLSVATTFFM
jgi:hypothetical protein